MKLIEDNILESKNLNSISFKHKNVKCLRKYFSYRKLLFKYNVNEDGFTGREYDEKYKDNPDYHYF